MTIPYLMNCAHSGTGWCLDCANKLVRENELLKKTSSRVRDYLFDQELSFDIPDEVYIPWLAAISDGDSEK